jgi:uncharacterized protein YdeI (YjbR/CyaY-like superfamily)
VTRPSALERAPLVEAEDAKTWRRWLEAHHADGSGAWLVTWKPGHGRGVLEYEAAVEEALCFGWVDGQVRPDAPGRSRLYFAARRPQSPWAASNRSRVERLIAEGRMRPAGLAVVEAAKANGGWDRLAESERGVVPEDLAAALAAHPPAAERFAAFPPGTQRMILAWIATAKRPATRAARIERTATLAQRDLRANEWRMGTPRD